MRSLLTFRRRPVPRVVVGFVICTAGVVLAACSSSSSPSSGGSGGTDGTSNKLDVGIVTFSTSDVDTNNLVTSMTANAQQRGWKIENVNADGDLSKANSAIRTLATKKVDAIVVTVFDSNALAAGLTAARNANVPVLSVGGGLAPGVGFSTNDGAGDPMAKMLVKDLNGQGTVLNLTYHPGVPCRQRAESFDKIVKPNAGIKVTENEISIPGAADTSKTFTNAWLIANKSTPNPTMAIFNCYDDNALGAIAALKQANRTGVKVYSFNATPPALAAVEEGSMTATLWLDLKSAGDEAIDTIPQIISQGSSWKPKEIIPKYVIVTKDNLDQFKKDHPAGG